MRQDLPSSPISAVPNFSAHQWFLSENYRRPAVLFILVPISSLLSSPTNLPIQGQDPQDAYLRPPFPQDQFLSSHS